MFQTPWIWQDWVILSLFMLLLLVVILGIIYRVIKIEDDRDDQFKDLNPFNDYTPVYEKEGLYKAEFITKDKSEFIGERPATIFEEESRVIADIVTGLKENAEKREQISTVEHVANRIHTTKSFDTHDDEEDFWEHIEAQIELMTPEQRDELQQLVNKLNKTT